MPGVTNIEFRTAQAVLGLTQPAMAAMLKCSLRTVSGMANRSSPIHPSTATLLKLMLLLNLSPADLP